MFSSCLGVFFLQDGSGAACTPELVTQNISNVLLEEYLEESEDVGTWAIELLIVVSVVPLRCIVCAAKQLMRSPHLRSE